MSYFHMFWMCSWFNRVCRRSCLFVLFSRVVTLLGWFTSIVDNWDECCNIIFFISEIRARLFLFRFTLLAFHRKWNLLARLAYKLWKCCQQICCSSYDKQAVLCVTTCSKYYHYLLWKIVHQHKSWWQVQSINDFTVSFSKSRQNEPSRIHKSSNRTVVVCNTSQLTLLQQCLKILATFNCNIMCVCVEVVWIIVSGWRNYGFCGWRCWALM